METFDFGIKLVDAVSQPGKRAVETLRQVEQQAKKTQQSVAGGKELANFGKQLERVGFAAARAQQRAAEQADRARQRMYDRAVRNAHRAASGDGNDRFSLGKLTQASFIGSLLANAVSGIVGGMVEGAKKAVDVFAEGLKFAFEEAGKQQTLRLGERLSLGEKGGAEFREDVGRFSKLTGFDDDAIRSMLLPMRRAGMNQQGVRTAFAAAGDIAAGEGRGGDQGRIQELLGVFTKIQQKGGINEKGLLALGINTKDFYADLGKQLKVSAKAAQEAAESGKHPQLLLNTLYRGIERQQGGKLGTGVTQYSQTFEARMNRFKNLPSEYAKGILDSPLFQRATETLGQLLEKLDPDSPAGRRIQASLDRMFDKITNLIGDPAEAADKFAASLETAVDITSQLVTVASELADAFLPSLDTIEDMVLAFREMKAIGNPAEQERVRDERKRVDQKRINRAAETEIKAATPELFASKLKTSMLEESLQQTIVGDYGGPLALNPLGFGTALSNASATTMEAQNSLRTARGSSKQTTVNIPKIELNFHGPVDEDTAKKVATATHTATTNALEGARTAGI